MRYNHPDKKIPVVSVSTVGANRLSDAIKQNSELDLFFRTTSYHLPDVESYNVVGEIKGTENPDEIIVVGGHIDSWFNGEGAHDDGAGCIHSIEVLRIFRTLGIKPKHTIRAVMFVDEEIAQTGGKEYARLAKQNNEKHLLALESDAGGFSPRGFTIDADDEVIAGLQSFLKYFKPYGIHEIVKGYGGVDIKPLKSHGTPLVGFRPDNQRYFDYHHAATDKFEAVNFRELQMGSAAIAAFIYLVDQHGF
jgi:Zn-dependent M28 family amino/carboxypeptidase